MKKLLVLAAVASLASSSALADDAKKENPIAPDATSVTEKVGEAVPTMKGDGKPAVESTAPDSQTYTDKVGEAVPTMKAPKDE